MLSLIFIQFLVYTAYCEFSVVNQVITDPTAFVQTFAKANPAQINEVIKIIEGLVAEGQDKKSKIIATHDAAEKVLADANADLAKALDEFETARGERKLADEFESLLRTKLAKRKDEETAALNTKNLKSEILTDAQNWLDTENKRIDAEKAILEEVIDVLNGLKDNSGRRLLSVQSHLAPILPALIESAKVNPDSIDKVVGMVTDLIADGERVRTKAKADRNSAQSAFDKAEAEWKAAVQATIDATDALNAAVADAANKLSVEKVKEEIWEKATAAQERAAEDEAAKLKIEQEQVPILDHENEELLKVIDILKDMLKKME